MTIGRSNSAVSDTRSSVSWKVERAPNSGRNCFGRPSRDAGHSRVPAPPHMIRGMIRLLIGLSFYMLYAVIFTIPLCKMRDTVLDRCCGLEADLALERRDV